MVRVKRTLTNTNLQGKVDGEIMRKASKSVVGRCKGMDRAELEWTETDDRATWRKHASNVASMHRKVLGIQDVFKFGI